MVPSCPPLGILSPGKLDFITLGASSSAWRYHFIHLAGLAPDHHQHEDGIDSGITFLWKLICRASFSHGVLPDCETIFGRLEIR
jgi:hypothetical protein